MYNRDGVFPNTAFEHLKLSRPVLIYLLLRTGSPAFGQVLAKIDKQDSRLLLLLWYIVTFRSAHYVGRRLPLALSTYACERNISCLLTRREFRSRTNRMTVMLAHVYAEISPETFRLDISYSRVILYAARSDIVRTTRKKMNQNGTDSPGWRQTPIFRNRRNSQCRWHTYTRAVALCIFTELTSSVYSTVWITRVCVANVSGKFAEQAVLRAASRGNFVLGQ